MQLLKEKIKLRLEPDDEEKEAVGVLVAVTSCADGYVARGEGGVEMRECRATLPHRRNFHDVRGRGGGGQREK